MTRSDKIRRADERARAQAENAAATVRRWVDEQGLMCDFCARTPDGDVVAYTIDAPLVTELAFLSVDDLGAGKIGVVQSEEWLACPQCDPVVAAGDPAALAAHAVANRDRRRVPLLHVSEAEYVATLTEMYQRFYAGNPTRKGTT